MMNSLGQVLSVRSLAELQVIAEWWGALPPHSTDQDDLLALERQMRDTLAARTVWQRLPPDDRTALLAIVGPAARNWHQIALLPKQTGLEPEAVTAALARLKAAFIVYEDHAKMQGGELVGQRNPFYGFTQTRGQKKIEEHIIAYVPTEIATALYATGRELSPKSADRTKATVDDLLAPYRQGDLDQIGRRYGLTVQTYCSRNEVRAIIAQNVIQAEAVHYAMERLPDTLREFYLWLFDQGGCIPTATVQQHMEWRMPDLLVALHTLEEYAIAFDAFQGSERVVFIPAQTLESLRRATLKAATKSPPRWSASRPRARMPPTRSSCGIWRR